MSVSYLFLHKEKQLTGSLIFHMRQIFKPKMFGSSCIHLFYILHASISLFIELMLLFPVCYRDVKPIEHQLRPKGLGLGADRSAIKDLEPSRHQRPPKPGEERGKEEELVMGPGGCVLVESGAHKDLYGKVWHGLHPYSSSVDMQ